MKVRPAALMEVWLRSEARALPFRNVLVGKPDAGRLKEGFRTLDLRPGATLEEIKRSYRKLANVWLPDRPGLTPAH